MVDPTGLAGFFLLVPHCCLSYLLLHQSPGASFGLNIEEKVQTTAINITAITRIAITLLQSQQSR